MMDTLIGGLEHNIHVLCEQYKTQIAMGRVHERMGAIGSDVEI